MTPIVIMAMLDATQFEVFLMIFTFYYTAIFVTKILLGRG